MAGRSIRPNLFAKNSPAIHQVKTSTCRSGGGPKVDRKNLKNDRKFNASACKTADNQHPLKTTASNDNSNNGKQQKHPYLQGRTHQII
ncbi:hypothetical protein ACHAQJ_009928 [Trichoderma viride]